MGHRRELFIFAAYFVIYEFSTYVSNDMIMPAMVEIVHQFNAPLTTVPLSLSLYIIGGSLLQVFLGPMADVIGKRKVLLFGNVLFLIATIVIPFSNSIDHFLASRFFQGMGLCFIFIGYATIHEVFDDVEAVKLTAILSNIAIFAPLIGPLIGSIIIHVSSWEFVFILSGILATVSLIGLYFYMPTGKIIAKTINISEILISYKNIFTHKTFILGIVTTSVGIIPMIAWIGLSPVIILNRLYLSFTHYIAYQSAIFGGFIISNLMIQKLAGRVSFTKLINYGAILSLVGLTIAISGCFININLAIVGMVIYAFGLGLYNGVIVRIAISSTGESMSLSSSAMSLITCTILFSGLEISSNLSHMFNYSLTAFTFINFVIGVIVFFLLKYFARITRSRNWH